MVIGGWPNAVAAAGEGHRIFCRGCPARGVTRRCRRCCIATPRPLPRRRAAAPCRRAQARASREDSARHPGAGPPKASRQAWVPKWPWERPSQRPRFPLPAPGRAPAERRPRRMDRGERQSGPACGTALRAARPAVPQRSRQSPRPMTAMPMPTDPPVSPKPAASIR